MPLDLTVTYDPTTPVGMVRFAIQDLDIDTQPPEEGTTRDQWSVLFTDQEIQLTINKYLDKVNVTDLAGAELLENIANSTALTARLITLGDYTSDTRQTANSLRAQAQWLRNRWSQAQAAGADEPAEYINEEPWDALNWGRIIIENR